MKKNIGGKVVNITEYEWQYYLQLITDFTTNQINAENFFKDLFTTNTNDDIILIKPIHVIPEVFLFFIQNLMINQRLAYFDNLKKEIHDLKEQINHLKSNKKVKNND